MVWCGAREGDRVAASIPSSQIPVSPAQLASVLAKFRPGEREKEGGREARCGALLRRSGLLQLLLQASCRVTITASAAVAWLAAELMYLQS